MQERNAGEKATVMTGGLWLKNVGDTQLMRLSWHKCQYLWKKSIDLLDFLHGDNHQGKVAGETITFWLGVIFCVSHSIRFKTILFSTKTGKNQLISLIFCTHIIINEK